MKFSDVEIAVILPAYNEEQTLGETIRDFARYLPKAHFVIVDNNSTDATSEVARQTLNELDIRGVVVFEPRQGKGNAVRRAFMEADADIFVMSDADQTYPADQVEQLLAPVLNGEADMVVGDRHTGGDYGDQNKRKFHTLGNQLVRRMVNSLFKAELADIMSGYRVFSRRFVKNYPVLVSGFQIETDMTLHALDKRFVIKEVAVKYQDRPEGSESKLDTFGDGTRVLFTIIQILRYYRPMVFFGTFSLMFFFAGLLAGYPVIMDWILHQYIYQILDSITHQNKMAFEHKLLSEKRTSD